MKNCFNVANSQYRLISSIGLLNHFLIFLICWVYIFLQIFIFVKIIIFVNIYIYIYISRLLQYYSKLFLQYFQILEDLYFRNYVTIAHKFFYIIGFIINIFFKKNSVVNSIHARQHRFLT